MIDSVLCPCCQSGNSKDLGKLPDSFLFAGKVLETKLEGGNLYLCLECQLKYRFPILTNNDYIKLYDNFETSTWSFDKYRSDWDILKKHINNFSVKNKIKVLDYGCYTGGFLFGLDQSIDKYGIEINNSAAEIAMKKAGATVWSSISKIPEGEKFDIIVIIDVIEHVPNPASLLHELRERLNSEGCLIISTGDAHNTVWNLFKQYWWYCYYPEHISFVSEKWVKWFCLNGRFRLLHVQKFKLGKLGILKKINQFIHITGYGLLGVQYLSLLTRFKGTAVTPDPGGKGLLNDHIVITLKRSDDE